MWNILLFTIFLWLIRQEFFHSITIPSPNPSYKTDLDLWDCFGKGKTCIIAKFHRTDLVFCSLAAE